MKKVLFLALAAAAVMSCSESEEIENAGQKAEIKLGTVVGNTTRATVTDLPELQKVGFTVYAYNTGATTMASVATFDAMKEFMAAVKVTYSAPDWSLTGGTYYWPMTDNKKSISSPTYISNRSLYFFFSRSISVRYSGISSLDMFQNVSNGSGEWDEKP